MPWLDKAKREEKRGQFIEFWSFCSDYGALGQARPRTTRNCGKAAEVIVNAMTGQDQRSVAVADFTDLQGQGSDAGRLLADELTSKLVAIRKNVIVVDRSALMYALRKQGWKMEDLDDPENLRALASRLKLGAVARGTVVSLGADCG